MIRITFSNDYSFYQTYFKLHDSIGIFNEESHYVEIYKYRIEDIYIEYNKLYIIDNNKNEIIVPCTEIDRFNIEI